MDKTSEKVAKDPKRQERGKKSHETYMKRLRGKILEDNQLPTDRPTPSTPSSTPPTTSSTANSTPSTPLHTMRPSDTYVYVLVYLLPLPLVLVYFLHITLFSRKIKKIISEKQDQPPKRCHML